jgi:hypothetical protein
MNQATSLDVVDASLEVAPYSVVSTIDTIEAARVTSYL